jgi:hypothetical protein
MRDRFDDSSARQQCRPENRARSFGNRRDRKGSIERRSQSAIEVRVGEQASRQRDSTRPRLFGQTFEDARKNLDEPVQEAGRQIGPSTLYVIVQAVASSQVGRRSLRNAIHERLVPGPVDMGGTVTELQDRCEVFEVPGRSGLGRDFELHRQVCPWHSDIGSQSAGESHCAPDVGSWLDSDDPGRAVLCDNGLIRIRFVCHQQNGSFGSDSRRLCQVRLYRRDMAASRAVEHAGKHGINSV